ncbi:MAG: hypothetical protein OXN97_09065 [Bryobacterales bacterium]|nr:hypothetical protein [Bryobacterales bacterium]
MESKTGTFGRSRFSPHSPLPITVFFAAPGHAAFVARGWRPPEPLSVRLAELPNGGSIVFPKRTGHLPGLSGRLNPILGSIDRMYLYTANVAIDEGRPQPVRFRLGQPLRLTDVYGNERVVKFAETLGKLSLLEYLVA